MSFPPLYLILDAGLLLSELALVWRRRASRAPSTRQDRGSHRLLWAVIVGSIIGAHLAALSHVGPRLFNSLAWHLFGVGVFAAGTALRWWSIVHLGRFFSVDVAIAHDHKVVDTGPASVSRAIPPTPVCFCSVPASGSCLARHSVCSLLRFPLSLSYSIASGWKKKRSWPTLERIMQFTPDALSGCCREYFERRAHTA